jgi:hypothetical protein
MRHIGSWRLCTLRNANVVQRSCGDVSSARMHSPAGGAGYDVTHTFGLMSRTLRFVVAMVAGSGSCLSRRHHLRIPAGRGFHGHLRRSLVPGAQREENTLRSRLDRSDDRAHTSPVLYY